MTQHSDGMTSVYDSFFFLQHTLSITYYTYMMK